jgi:hypothetical protein
MAIETGTPAPGPHGARSVKEGKVLRLLQLAMAQGRPMAARYRGQTLTLSPHLLGRRGDDLYVLVFAVATDGERRTPLRWQWLRAEELEDLTLQEGFWLTAPGERPSADFLDRVIAQAVPPVASDDTPSL